MKENISFRLLEFNDMELLHKWLNTDFVKEWYGDKKGYTLEGVLKKYGKYITNEAPTTAYIIQINNKDVGYIQTYLISNYPEYNKYIGAGKDSAGLDLYIGEGDYIHKGYGKYIIKHFLEAVVFANPKVAGCILGPNPKNIAAIRTYSNVGFKYVKTIQIPNEDEPEYVMKITRGDIGL